MGEIAARRQRRDGRGSSASPPPAGSAASKPLDFLKFQRLFQDRLLVGDPEVLSLIKNGTMMVTPEQMHQLMEQWEKKALAADLSKPEKPAENLPRPGRIASRRMAEKPVDQAATLASAPCQATAESQDFRACLGRGRLRRLRQIEPGASARHRPHRRPGRPQHGRRSLRWPDRPPWGTVVRKDGYIVTKASEVHGKLTCRIGARELPATVVKSKTEYDLALLKVDANDLVPITWADGDPPLARQLADNAGPGKRRPWAGRSQHSGPRHSRRAEDPAPQSGHRRRGARSDGQGRPRPRGRPESARGQGRPEGGRRDPEYRRPADADLQGRQPGHGQVQARRQGDDGNHAGTASR